MKKHFITILAAALAIAGCTKVSPGAPNTDEPDLPIKFQAANYVSSTKAGSNIEFTGESFMVQAYYTGDANWATSTLSDVVTYMNGVEVKKSNDVWAPYGKDYFWPKTGYLTFIGWAPATVTPTFNTSGATNFMTITPSSTLTDIMVSDFAYNKNVSNAGSGVPILFHHILSKINFKAKFVDTPDADGITHHAAITSLKFLKILNEGSYIIEGDAAVSTADWNAKWSLGSNYNDLVEDNYKYVNSSEILVGSTISSNFTDDLKTGSVDLISDAFVFPQTLDNQSKIELTYVIYYCNSSGKVLDKYEVTSSSPAADRQFQINTFSNSNGTITSWEQNKIYTYTIVIDPNSDQKITFIPTEEDWSEVDAAEKEI